MSPKAARLVADRGYTNVFLFTDGIAGWVNEGYELQSISRLPQADVPVISPDDLHSRFGTAQVVDIRTPSLYSDGVLEGAQRIPLSKLTKQYGSISKEQPIVLVDHADKQVRLAGRFLFSMGYTNVSRLQGGLKGWQDAGYALVPYDEAAKVATR